ncbi:SDR family NAD(P)-dependent oxidoreductase [Amycolatopsis speibonae]|uniref:SDR family NAD(P)-dependent oxidoreductase n=1 Tax=Amycolatopsis speibonae TaxID=1450224 RepID=A0ABV7P8K7_9PSEU
MVDTEKYGPWAVITGGSEGVGAAFALQLAEAGVNLMLIARKPGPLQETAAKARALGVEVRTLALDLLASGAAGEIIAAVSDVDVGLLVHNAGANSHGHEFLDGDLAGFQGVIDLNVTVPLALAHHFGARMKERRCGGILLVGSMAGYLGAARQSVYGGVKAFGRVFAEGLWLELREYGVDVLELVLGVTRTPSMERAGLNFDLPGLLVAEPADVAREGLRHLADGPVWVAGGNDAGVRHRSGVDRAGLVLAAHEAMTRLLPKV